MTTDTFGRRLLMFGRSLLPETRKRIKLAAIYGLAAEEERRAGDYRSALDKYRVAHELVAGISDFFPPLYRFGEAYSLFELGEAGDDEALKRAVELFEQVLDDTVTRHALWARAANGYACAQRLLGLREGNIERLNIAVVTLRVARDVVMPVEERVGWAAVQHNLGDALFTLGSHTDQRDLLREAVAAFEAAIIIRTQEGMPGPAAHSQYLLGQLLGKLSRLENDTAYLFTAVDAFAASAAAWDQGEEPILWAAPMEALGKTRLTLGMIVGDRSMMVSGRREVVTVSQVYKEMGDTEGYGRCHGILKEFDAALAP